METAPVTVGVDGSEACLRAVAVAAREARLRGCGLRVVHAFIWPFEGVYLGAPMIGPEDAVLRNAAKKLVDEAVEHARREAPDVEVEGAVVAGEALPVLLEETETAQLAVVAGRGLGAFERLLLGSTAARVSAHGHCPVLVVRGRPDPTGPVLLAVDGSRAGADAIDFAFAEAARRDSGVVAVHVWSAWTRHGPRPQGSAPPAGDSPGEEGERVLAEALAGFGEKYPDVPVEQRAVQGKARELLIDASESAGLLVAGARGRGGFAGLLLGSVSQALLDHAHCPVAVVRGTGERR